MSVNHDRMNHVFSMQDVQDIEAALDMLENKLSILRTLTSDERSRKVRLGVNNWGFVRVAKEAYDDLPELLPRFIDVDDYQNDLEMLMKMRPYKARFEQVLQLIDDSSILLGDLAYKDALGIFHGAQDSAKRGLPGAELWLERLEPRFYGQGPRIRAENDSESEDGGSQDDDQNDGGSGNPTNTGGSGTPNDGPADTDGTNDGTNDGGSDGNGGTNSNPDAA